jgi:hypothetical protein
MAQAKAPAVKPSDAARKVAPVARDDNDAEKSKRAASRERETAQLSKSVADLKLSAKPTVATAAGGAK